MSEASETIETTARNDVDGRGPRIVSGIALDVPAGRSRRGTPGAIGGSSGGGAGASGAGGALTPSSLP